MARLVDLSAYGIDVKEVLGNASPARLYEEAITNEKNTKICRSGALVAYSGEKTGRSPKDKRIVAHPDSESDVWWGSVNMKIDEEGFLINRERAVDYLNTCPRLYVVDGYAGWDTKYRKNIRIICSRAYHALFMHNMLIRPASKDLDEFKPDFVFYNAGAFPANSRSHYMTSKTSVAVSFERKEFVILGTQYAGEMKKGVFTLMNYIMPKQNVLSMHCSANEGDDNNVSLFFGLSGTGKTTLSADSQRKLIGDDEHCWSDQGIFNIEGGCYAKCLGLDEEKEPEIYRAIKFGSLLENVSFIGDTRKIDFNNSSITQNTRVSYPIEYIDNAKPDGIGGHPNHIIFLTCDAFGVLPPISKLTPEQAMYHFISGYTAKVAGTEMGVTEPVATFSPCFGAAFMVWHPSKYAELLAQKMRSSGATAWLINTGWTGGAYGTGSRISLKYTRSIIDAIHDGTWKDSEYVQDKIFGFEIPKKIKDIPEDVLFPQKAWKSEAEYDDKLRRLAGLFIDNFKEYADGCSKEILEAAPRI